MIPLHMTLHLNQITCIHESKESGADEVFVQIFPSGVCGSGPCAEYYKVNRLKMHSQDNRTVDITIPCSFMEKIGVRLVEYDPDGNHDILADFVLLRTDPVPTGYKQVRQTTGKKQAEYGLNYRVISKPIPTVRVLAVKCEQDSAGCNVDLVNAVTAVAADCAKAASKAISKSPRPSRKLMAEGFKAASKILANCGAFVTWVADKLEGDDDVYMQHIQHGETNQGGGFWPEGVPNYKMHTGSEVYFEELYGKYFRFPLDKGPVTLQLREADPNKGDVSLGALTILDTDFEKLMVEGAQFMVANDFQDSGDHHNGEGAVYHICYSVGIEDWAKEPNDEAQDEPYKYMPFPEKVLPIRFSSPDDFTKRILPVYKSVPASEPGQSNPNCYGITELDKGCVRSELRSGESHQTVLVDWRQPTALNNFLSIIGITGESAHMVDVKTYSSIGQNLKYKGWNGSTWVDGPASPDAGVYWYKAVITNLDEIFAKTYRNDGSGPPGTFKLWAFWDINAFEFPPVPTSFPFPDPVTPVVASNMTEWTEKLFGAKAESGSALGTLDEANQRVISRHTGIAYRVCTDSLVDVIRPNTAQILGVAGEGAAYVGICQVATPVYEVWNGTAWTRDSLVATPVDGVYWYRLEYDKMGAYVMLDTDTGLDRPFVVYAYTTPRRT